MPAIIAPSCGCVLLFYPGPQDVLDGSLSIMGSDPLPVFCAFVNTNDDFGLTVNVGGFDHTGKPFGRIAVPLLQDGDTIPTELVINSGEGEDYMAISRHCRWMSYQIEQAAKSATPPEEVKGYGEPNFQVPEPAAVAGDVAASTDASTTGSGEAGGNAAAAEGGAA